MKVTRAFVGQEVRLTWLDPTEIRAHVKSDGPPMRGRAALSRQVERGVIDDVTDGVVRICHTQTYHPGEEEIGEYRHSFILEDLITELTVLVPQAKPVEGGDTHV